MLGLNVATMSSWRLLDGDTRPDRKPSGWRCRARCWVNPEGFNPHPVHRWIPSTLPALCLLAQPAEDRTGVPTGGPPFHPATSLLLVVVPVAGLGSQKAQVFKQVLGLGGRTRRRRDPGSPGGLSLRANIPRDL